MNIEARIKQQKSEIKSGFYGTLTVGCGNWQHFLDGKSELLQERDVITGFALFSMGGLPIAVQTGLSKDVLVVDVFNNVELIDRIHNMELGAGYVPVRTVTESGHAVTVYVYENVPTAYSITRIESGDYRQWLERSRRSSPYKGASS